jgi:hypothetical protein
MGVVDPFIFNLGTRWDKFSASSNGRLKPREYYPVPSEHDIGWATEQSGRLRVDKRLSLLLGIEP